MKIEILPYKDCYAFRIREDNKGEIVFSSYRNFVSVPFIKEKYVYASDAKMDADKILKRDYHIKSLRKAKYEYEKPVAVEVSSESMIESHYMDLLSSMETRIRGDKGNSKLEKEDSKVIDMIVKELTEVIKNSDEKQVQRKLKSILNGFKKLKRQELADNGIKTAEANRTSDNIKEDLLLDYGEKVCKAIRNFHHGAFPIVRMDKNSGDTWIVDADSDGDPKPLLRIGINEDLMVNSVTPCLSISRIYPIHSVEFYQKYWKPIVEEIGHFYLDDNNMLMITSDNSLPDIPKGEKSFILSGWSNQKKNNDTVNISFKGDKPTWLFEASDVTKTASKNIPSKYTEQEYLDAIAKCIDPLLESIYGRTGCVIQVIPLTDHIEVDVDFGRGLDVVRLTEEQIEIIK